MSTLVQASHMRKSFGHLVAVNDVSLSVRPGEIYGLVGADGAGKTTTMRLLVGALKADAGEINICGYDVNRQTEQARSQFGYLSQRFSLYEDLTVLENIRFFAEVRGLSSTEWLPRSMEILEFVGLSDFKDRRAGQLSGGMKQKLGLASALVTRPRVLLLDEPTTGVDPVTRQDFWQLVIKLVSSLSGTSRPLASEVEAHATDTYRPSPRDASRSTVGFARLPWYGLSRTVPGADAQPSAHEVPVSSREGGVAVIISTPYMDEASRCHRVGFMKAGRIIAEDTPSNLRARLNGRVLELRGSPIGLLRHVAHKNPNVEDVQAFGDRLHIRVKENKAQEVLGRLKSEISSEGGEVDELRSVPPVLEDVFIALSESNDENSI